MFGTVVRGFQSSPEMAKSLGGTTCELCRVQAPTGVGPPLMKPVQRQEAQGKGKLDDPGGEEA